MSDMQVPVYIIQDPMPWSEAVDLITGCSRFKDLQNYILGATMTGKQTNDPKYFPNPALFTDFESALGELIDRISALDDPEQFQRLFDSLMELTPEDVML
jgi:hypothetical protein